MKSVYFSFLIFNIWIDGRYIPFSRGKSSTKKSGRLKRHGIGLVWELLATSYGLLLIVFLQVTVVRIE